MIGMFWKKESKNVKNEESEKKILQINNLLKISFGNVKRDTANIFQWMNYFYRRSMEQEQSIKSLQLEMSYMPKTREDIRRIVDDYYSFESLMSKMRDLNSKVEELAQSNSELKRAHIQPRQPAVQVIEKQTESVQDLSFIEKRLEKLEQKKALMKEKIMKRLTRNSKEYVKSVLLSYIRKYGKISALQLKDIVVDEQNFCSKSSFYRLLEEIEQTDEVGVVKQGKEKHYISKSFKPIQ